jgi:hypothetical protein
MVAKTGKNPLLKSWTGSEAGWQVKKYSLIGGSYIILPSCQTNPSLPMTVC